MSDSNSFKPTDVNKMFFKYIFISLIVTSIIFFIKCYISNETCNIFIFNNIEDNFFDITIEFVVSILGFLITSLAIIGAFYDNNIMQKFSKTEGYENLKYTFKYTFWGLFWNLAFLILSSLFDEFSHCFTIIIIFLIIFNILTIYRCIYVVLNMIFIITKHSK